MSAASLAKDEGCSTLSIPRFAPGMLLQHDDLEHLGEFPRELSRLIFRHLLGCGVVCGLVVDPKKDDCNQLKITVDEGLALGCSGHPIYVPRPHEFSVDVAGKEFKNGLWVVLCAKTKRTSPRVAACACEEDETTNVCTRQFDCYEIRVHDHLPPCACHCGIDAKPLDPAQQKAKEKQCRCDNSPCYDDHYFGVCACKCKCGCDCVVLARLEKKGTPAEWKADHGVRRFIRPMLMRDPKVDAETGTQTSTEQTTGSGATQQTGQAPAAPTS